jgi:hypothetical protein
MDFRPSEDESFDRKAVENAAKTSDFNTAPARRAGLIADARIQNPLF